MRLPFRPAPEARSRSERLRSTVAPAEKKPTSAKGETRMSHYMRTTACKQQSSLENSHAVPIIGLPDPSSHPARMVSPCSRSLSSTRSRVVLPRRPRGWAAAGRRLAGIGLTRRGRDGAELGTPIGTPNPLQSPRINWCPSLPGQSAVQCCLGSPTMERRTFKTFPKSQCDKTVMLTWVPFPLQAGHGLRYYQHLLLQVGSETMAYFPPIFP